MSVHQGCEKPLDCVARVRSDRSSPRFSIPKLIERKQGHRMDFIRSLDTGKLLLGGTVSSLSQSVNNVLNYLLRATDHLLHAQHDSLPFIQLPSLSVRNLHSRELRGYLVPEDGASTVRQASYKP